MLPDSFKDFYSRNSNYHDYNTRRKHSLSQPYYRTVRGHSQIRSTGVNLWNSLSPEIKNSPTLNTFSIENVGTTFYIAIEVIRHTNVIVLSFCV